MFWLLDRVNSIGPSPLLMANARIHPMPLIALLADSWQVPGHGLTRAMRTNFSIKLWWQQIRNAPTAKQLTYVNATSEEAGDYLVGVVSTNEWRWSQIMLIQILAASWKIWHRRHHHCRRIFRPRSCAGSLFSSNVNIDPLVLPPLVGHSTDQRAG